MKEETRAKLAEWGGKLGLPIAVLEKQFNDTMAGFKTSVTGKTDEWYEDAARRRMFLEIKGELQSPAKPFDVVYLGYSADIDVAAGDMEEKKALWNNAETRAQAVAEGKIYQYNPASGQPRMTVDVEGPDGKTVKQEVPDGTPMDTREWMIAPNPNAQPPVKGRKNPNYGRPLLPAIIRNYIGIGRPSIGGAIKLISLTGMGAERVKILPQIPPKFTATRARINVRADEPLRYLANMSAKTQFLPIEMKEFTSMKDVIKVLETAPHQLKPSLAELPAWHDANEKDTRRVAIVEGDVSRINRDPTPFGSLMLVLEDTSKEDLDAEGTTVWIPKELEEVGQLNFGPGSRVFALGRTTVGPGYNRDSGQLDPAIERIMMNASAIIVDPELRVPPEEASVLETATKVK